MRSKRKPNTSRGPDKHLDSASYWVQRFHQADAARTKLEVKVTEQEREIERLKSELRSVQKDSTRAPATTKRRKAEPPPGVSTRAAKRRKVVHEDSDTTDEDVEDTLPENMDALTAVNEGRGSSTCYGCCGEITGVQKEQSWSSIYTRPTSTTKAILEETDN